MNDHAKSIIDLSSITVVLATLVEWLPAAAALASLIWSIIRIYETQTVQRWIENVASNSNEYGEVILLGVVMAGLLLGAFRK
jgi:hypothetical protein